MANDPVSTFFDNLFSGDTPPALSDLNYGISSFRVDFLPPLNIDLDIKNIPEIKTQSGIGLSVEKLAPINVNAQVGLTALPDINTTVNANLNVGKLPTIDLVAVIRELPKIIIDAGLDNLRVRELAPINLQFSLKPARLKLPFGYSVKVGVLGLELFSFTMKGELRAELEDL